MVMNDVLGANCRARSTFAFYFYMAKMVPWCADGIALGARVCCRIYRSILFFLSNFTNDFK